MYEKQGALHVQHKHTKELVHFEVIYISHKVISIKRSISRVQSRFLWTKLIYELTYLVEINGSSIFSTIAWHISSSGIRIPTFFLDAYLAVLDPYLTHCFGNSLLAVKIKVYCYRKTVLDVKPLDWEKKSNAPITEVHAIIGFLDS